MGETTLRCSGYLVGGILDQIILAKLMNQGMKEIIGGYVIEKNAYQKGAIKKAADEAGEKTIEEGATETAGEASTEVAGEVAGEAATEAATEAAGEAVGEALLAAIPGLNLVMFVIMGLTAISWLTLMFDIQNVGMEPIMEGVSCILGRYIKQVNDSGCIAGYSVDKTHKKCVACPQIYGMKDYETTFKGKYNKSDTKTDYPNISPPNFDPALVNKLTDLSCPMGAHGEGPVYAARPFPGGGCYLKDDNAADRGAAQGGWEIGGKVRDNETYYTFFTSDQRLCTGDKVEKFHRPDVAGDEITRALWNDTSIQYHFKNMDYQNPPSPNEAEPCEDPNDSLSCWWHADNLENTGVMGGLSEDYGWWDSALGGETMPYPPNKNTYDGPNVCNNNNGAQMELAGDYSGQGITYDPSSSGDIVKDRDPVHVSNHCCPKIIGSEDCPKYGDSKSVTLFSSPGEFGGNTKPWNYPDTSRCYVYDNDYPEFFPEDLTQGQTSHIYFQKKSNSNITELRRGGIQCGPRGTSTGISGGDYGTQIGFSRDGQTGIFDVVGLTDTFVDVLRPSNPGATTGTPQGPNDSPGDYYGTRFKLDNRYAYNSENDSGATGYEYYLDPEDYISLSSTSGISQVFNSSWRGEKSLQNMDNIGPYTTINDIIPRQLGHPDRKKRMCDNFICNDIEKTQYIQTIYDGFCTNWSQPGDMGSMVKNVYKKFYRPVGIRKEGQNVSNTFGATDPHEKRKMYPDICCDPIPHSNKWAFVGCDATGKNSYFIDDIYTDPSPTYPIPVQGRREKIPPQSRKQNINQCIPSKESKCVIATDIASNWMAISASAGDDLIREAYEYTQLVDDCDNYLDYIGMLNIGSDNSISGKELTDICENSQGGILSPGTCTATYPEYLSDASPRDSGSNKYWLENRKVGGYVPTKNSITTWAVSPTEPNLFDFRLNPPEDVYNACSAIPDSTNISDIEIYDKRIDWNNGKLRFISGDSSPPPPSEDLFKIICKSDPFRLINYNNSISSPIPIGNDYHYEVSCESTVAEQNIIIT